MTGMRERIIRFLGQESLCKMYACAIYPSKYRYDKEEKVTAETDRNPPMAVNELRLVFLT